MVGRQSCCVKACKNTAMNSKCSFYKFPRAIRRREQRTKWIVAVNRKNTDGSLWFPKLHDTICSAHFIGGKKSDEQGSPSYVPTIFPDSHDKYKSVTVVRQKLCAMERSTKNEKNAAIVPLTMDNTISEKEASSSSEEISQQSHEDHPYECCSMCKNVISGCRYVCVQCEEYGVCSACDAAGAHPRHYVLRVPAARPPEEFTAVLQRVRSEMQNCLATLPESECLIEVSAPKKIKTEADPLSTDSDTLSLPEEQKSYASNILEEASIDIKFEVKEEQDDESDLGAGASETADTSIFPKQEAESYQEIGASETPDSFQVLTHTTRDPLVLGQSKTSSAMPAVQSASVPAQHTSVVAAAHTHMTSTHAVQILSPAQINTIPKSTLRVTSALPKMTTKLVPGKITLLPMKVISMPVKVQTGPGKSTAGPGKPTTGPGKPTAGPGKPTAGPSKPTAGPAPVVQTPAVKRIVLKPTRKRPANPPSPS